MAVQKVKKLYRSKKDRMLAGVCGGIGEYFGIDSTLIRILWVLLSLGGGAGWFLRRQEVKIYKINLL